MLYLITYDIRDNRRRYRIDRLLKGYGVRAQKSLYECWLEEQQLESLLRRLGCRIDPQQDSIHLYALCEKDASRVRVQGHGDPPHNPDFLLF